MAITSTKTVRGIMFHLLKCHSRFQKIWRRLSIFQMNSLIGYDIWQRSGYPNTIEIREMGWSKHSVQSMTAPEQCWATPPGIQPIRHYICNDQVPTNGAKQPTHIQVQLKSDASDLLDIVSIIIFFQAFEIPWYNNRVLEGPWYG